MWLRHLEEVIFTIVYFLVVLSPVWNSVIDSDFLKIVNRSTWHEGLRMCDNNSGYFMPSYDQINESVLNTLKNISAMPLWLYAIEYRKNDLKNIQIQAQEANMSARVICINDSGNINDIAEQNYREAERTCSKRNFKIIDISRKSAYDYYLSRAQENSSIWVRDVDIPSFLRGDKSNSHVSCLLLDENGELTKDECSKEHNVVCLKGEVYSTLVYTPVHIPQYVPSSDGSSDTGTAAPSTDIISSSGGITQTDTQDPIIVTTESKKQEGFLNDMDLLYIVIAAAGGAVFLVLIIVCCCCCCCCKKKPEKGQGPQLSEVYSDAADSITMRQLDKKQTDYAIPEDAIRSQKARPRLSIGEDEYDTIQQTAKNKTLKPNANANVYSHVTVQNAQNRYENHDTPEENPYDVTSYGGKNTVVMVSNSANEQYGHVQINTLP